MSIWDVNSIQFARLLAEIRAMGLTSQQYNILGDSMDLDISNIDELFERAEEEWQAIKDATGHKAEVKPEKSEQIESVKEVIRCPFCASTSVEYIIDWDATHTEDEGNTAKLTEWQCRPCDGRSFWI